LGFRVLGLGAKGLRVWGLALYFRVDACKVKDLRTEGLKLRVQGLDFRV
jgi:hypothetical protein